jgi:cobaltochelatase CobS
MNMIKTKYQPITVKKDGDDVQFGPIRIPGYRGRDAVPDTIEWFRFTDQHVDIVMDIISGNRVVLTGHTGCGKTTALEQVASRIGVGVTVLNMSECTDSSSLLGSYVARKESAEDKTSSTIFMDGPLVTAMKEGRWVIMDEMDFASPGVMTLLNGISSTTKNFLNQEVAGGEVVTVHPDFRLMGTANTIGPMADYRHLYSGTPPMNPAQLERYRVHVIDYLNEEEEVEAVLGGSVAQIVSIGGRGEEVNAQLVLPFVRMANSIRELFVQGEISTPISTRGIINWVAILIRNISVYRNVKTKGDIIAAVERAAGPSILNKMSTADAMKVMEMMTATNLFASLTTDTVKNETPKKKKEA